MHIPCLGQKICLYILWALTCLSIYERWNLSAIAAFLVGGLPGAWRQKPLLGIVGIVIRTVTNSLNFVYLRILRLPLKPLKVVDLLVEIPGLVFDGIMKSTPFECFKTFIWTNQDVFFQDRGWVQSLKSFQKCFTFCHLQLFWKNSPCYWWFKTRLNRWCFSIVYMVYTRSLMIFFSNSTIPTFCKLGIPLLPAVSASA